MKRRNLILAVIAFCIAAYWGAERGSYQAHYHWARIAVERKEKKDAESEQQQKTEKDKSRIKALSGIDPKTIERWNKYEQCQRLGAVKTGRDGSSEERLSRAMPIWMQYCLNGNISVPITSNVMITQPQQ